MSKSVEHSLRELTAMQLEFKRRIDDIESNSTPLPLSEQFQLYGLREVKGREITGDNYTTANVKIQKVEFINQFGYFDICVWVTNPDQKIVFVSPEIYSRGLSGSESGHGKTTLVALHTFLQNLANQSGFTIVCFSSLNVGSEQLNAMLGFPIPQLLKTHVSNFKRLVPRDQFINWLELLETLTHEASYYYQFVPAPSNPIEVIPEETLRQVIDFFKLGQIEDENPTPRAQPTPIKIVTTFQNLVRNLFG
jgi:hypothetical protein